MPPSPLAPRLQRQIDGARYGASLYGFLRRKAPAMRAASERGRPAVSAVSAELAAKFGAAAESRAFRQLAGQMIAQIMRAEGFVLVDNGVRLSHDALFATGARYARPDGGRAAAAPPANMELLRRLVGALTPAELRALQALVQSRLGKR
ncbi:MAG: hypothetical protein IT557_17665 [Alphaproteobacteria bacterium]|nr:hypothetical protein [Alphaproteobacteria bacterium]